MYQDTLLDLQFVDVTVLRHWCYIQFFMQQKKIFNSLF